MSHILAVAFFTTFRRLFNGFSTFLNAISEFSVACRTGFIVARALFNVDGIFSVEHNGAFYVGRNA